MKFTNFSLPSKHGSSLSISLSLSLSLSLSVVIIHGLYKWLSVFVTFIYATLDDHVRACVWWASLLKRFYVCVCVCVCVCVSVCVCVYTHFLSGLVFVSPTTRLLLLLCEFSIQLDVTHKSSLPATHNFDALWKKN